MCWRYVGLSGRRSTMMSTIAPRVARTSFVSGAGGYWKCIPRTVPLRLLKATFACAMTGLRPWSANSCWQNDRAKKPRLSSRRSMSMTKAPFSLVSVKIIQSPRKSAAPFRPEDTIGGGDTGKFHVAEGDADRSGGRSGGQVCTSVRLDVEGRRMLSTRTPTSGVVLPAPRLWTQSRGGLYTIRMRVCVYEDRPTDAVGVKILVLSLLQHCPGTSIDLQLPFASPDLVRWFEGKPGVRVSTARDPSRSGYQVKARLLLAAPDAGATEAVWLDTDIVVAGDLAGKLAAFPADAIVVAQEYFGAPGQGGSQRTRALGLEPGRRMPDTANSCVVRVTPAHRELLEEWDRLLTSDGYREAQAKQWFERPLHLLGDQDVLTALLGSARFAKTPIGWLRRGSDVAQCF